MLAAVLLSLAAQEDAPVRDLLRRLRDDAPEIREEATEALYARGAEAEPLLRSELERTGSLEVRGRLQEVLGRLDRDRARRRFRGGPEVEGFSARLSAKPAPHGGHALTLEIMNVGPGPASLVVPKRWDYRKHGWSSSSSSSHGCVVYKPRNPPPRSRWGGAYGCGTGPSRESVTLSPGESHRHTFKVGTALDVRGALPPGEYDVHVVYYAKRKKLIPGAEADLVSTTVTIRID